MQPEKPDNDKPATGNSASSVGQESKSEARTMEEELAAIHEAFESGKRRRARAAESVGNENGFFMELLRNR